MSTSRFPHREPQPAGVDYVMTYSGPQLLLDTEVGPVQVTFTDGSHCHVSANASSGSDPGDVVYRGRHWYVSMHLYGATKWTEDSGDPEQGSYRHQFTESGTFGGKVVPRTYREAIVAAIVKAVREYVSSHTGTLHAAAVNHLQHDWEDAQKDAQRASEAYGKAERKANEIGRELQRAQAAQAMAAMRGEA